jgi:hypothetical protein
MDIGADATDRFGYQLAFENSLADFNDWVSRQSNVLLQWQHNS